MKNFNEMNREELIKALAMITDKMGEIESTAVERYSEKRNEVKSIRHRNEITEEDKERMNKMRADNESIDAVVNNLKNFLKKSGFYQTRNNSYSITTFVDAETSCEKCLRIDIIQNALPSTHEKGSRVVYCNTVMGANELYKAIKERNKIAHLRTYKHLTKSANGLFNKVKNFLSE